MGRLLRSLGPRRRAQPSFLPHPSTPKFHLLLILPPFPLIAFKITLQDFWTWIHFFSRYTLHIQAKNTEHMARSLSVAQMPKVASGEHGTCNHLVVALQWGCLPCWTVCGYGKTATGTWVHGLERSCWDLSPLPCSMMVAVQRYSESCDFISRKRFAWGLGLLHKCKTCCKKCRKGASVSCPPPTSQ